VTIAAPSIVACGRSGLPGGTGDRIRISGSGVNPCTFGLFTATRPVDNGNISIHQAS
jgi:hypothetical protein